MPYSNRLFAILVALGLLIGAVACGNDAPQAWSEENLLKHVDAMGNAGTAYAVHDICMPMIEGDEEISSRVSLTIGAKRYTQLLEMDTQAEYDKLIDFYRRKGGTDDQIDVLETAYQDEYDVAAEKLTSASVCEETVTDFHNTILNTRVRQASGASP